MTGIFKDNAREYRKTVESYLRYLKTYALFNGGSTKGATPFQEFYEYKIYTTKYADARSIGNSSGYR